MLQVTIGTNTERKTVLAEVTATLNETFETNEVLTAGCALYLNGSLISGADAAESFEALGIADGGKVMIIAVKKADSAQ